MKRLLILSVLTALTAATAGCCGIGGGCFGRRECAPAYDGCNECGPAPCGGGECGCNGGPAMMGAPVMSSPTVVTPGPAYSARYLPR